MFFLAGKAVQVRSVPQAIRALLGGVAPLLWLAGGAACSAVALIWLAMAI